jgi:hypothetical protein
MSLIDEALKRAQAKHQEEPRRVGDAEAWVPTPMPDPARHRRRRLAALLAAAVVVVLAAGAAYLLFGRRPAPDRRPAAKESSSPAASPAPEVTFLPEAVVEPPRVADAGPGAPERARPPGRSAEASAAGSRPAEPERPAAAAAPPDLPPAEGPQARRDLLPSGNARGARADVRTFTGEAVLADGVMIELGGIVYSEEKPVALLNGKVLGPDAFLLGYRIVRIDPDRVELADANDERSRIVIVLR